MSNYSDSDMLDWLDRVGVPNKIKFDKTALFSDEKWLTKNSAGINGRTKKHSNLRSAIKYLMRKEK